MVIVAYPFGVKRTGQAVYDEIVKNKKQLEKNGKEFPFNRIVSIQTIIKWMDEFEWEEHRLEKQYEKNTTIDDTVNEFNQLQIERKTKRINLLNNALDALLNIQMKLSMKLATINPQNEDGTITQEHKSLAGTIARIGYLYNTLESLHGNQTIQINVFKGYTQEWQEIKERLQPQHNPYTTDDDFLEAQFKLIDQFYDEYDTEE